MSVLSINRRQATRQLPRRETATFTWKKSWNIGVLVALALSCLVYLTHGEQLLPVNHFEVVGDLQHQQQQPIETLLQGYQGEGFFALPIHQLKFEMLQLPWVEQASVQRIWPDRLRVSIAEKTPLARWDGEHLLSTRGDVFAADVAQFEGLPLIYASTHSPAWAMKQFFQLDTAFRSVGEQLVALRIDGRAAFELALQSGLVIKLGRDQIDKKVGRLIAIYAREIEPRKALIDQLDLRYSNGFAITWKAGTESQDKASIWSESNV